MPGISRTSSVWMPVAVILIAMLSIQSGASLAKSLFPLVGAPGVTALRIALGTLILVVIFKPWRLRVKKEQRLPLLFYGLALGAGVPCYRIYGDAGVAAAYAGLADAARIIGGWQIQSRASVGGNVCNASPAGDSIPALIAYNAVCRIAGPQGQRKVPIAEFFTGPGKTVLGRGELLAALRMASA